MHLEPHFKLTHLTHPCHLYSNLLPIHTMNTPTLGQLKRALVISEQIEALQKELGGIFGNHPAPVTKSAPAAMKPKRGGMSAAGRARIAAAQKLRWAKIKGRKAPAKAKAPATAPVKKKTKMSAQGLANIKAAQKKRWAKIKAGKKAQPAKAQSKAAAPAKKKRTPMSAEAKAKLSAMMKARWNAAKAGTGPTPTAKKK